MVFPSLQPVFPGITSQRNFLHLNLHLRVCSWKIPQVKIILSSATLVRSFPLISLMVLYIPWLASGLQSLFLPFLPLIAPRSSFFLKHCLDVLFPLVFYYYSHLLNRNKSPNPSHNLDHTPAQPLTHNTLECVRCSC